MSAQSSAEPNLSDAIHFIGESGLEKSKISHWCCSIRAVAAALGLPPESVPARWQAIAHRVNQLHHARVAMSEKTLKNHIANLKAALRHLSGDKTIPARGTPLTPEWSELRELVNHEMNRYHLTGLMRFASMQSISPKAVRTPGSPAELPIDILVWTLPRQQRSIVRAEMAASDRGWSQHKLTKAPL
jgi:hypothetical protein